jgi:hypothetical protein
MSHKTSRVIRAGYAANPPVCYPEIVKLLFEAYYTKFVDEFSPKVVDTITRVRKGWIPALRSEFFRATISVCEQTGHISDMRDKIARQKFRLLLLQMKASF